MCVFLSILYLLFVLLFKTFLLSTDFFSFARLWKQETFYPNTGEDRESITTDFHIGSWMRARCWHSCWSEGSAMPVTCHPSLPCCSQASERFCFHFPPRFCNYSKVTSNLVATLLAIFLWTCYPLLSFCAALCFLEEETVQEVVVFGHQT